MTRVKMDAKHGSESTANYKVLQDVFKAHKVEKGQSGVFAMAQTILGCYPPRRGLRPGSKTEGRWHQHIYDCVYRSSPKLTGAGGLSSTLKGHVKPTGLRAASSKDESIENAALKQKVNQLTEALEGTEKERDFYFSKLSDIEVLVESKVESLKDEGESDPTLEQIKTILYATEDGFEIAEEADVGDDETF
ncbi:hypothetical protein FRB93_004965 [Tulasnella sp. JGI-2019a]|nr:hypothetical protein FRB93_004965 [Tulasnella sp. JGI-2019a]